MSEQYDTPYGPDMLSMRQAAAFLGLEEITFRNDWKDRKLEATKIGGRVYFARQDLLDYIELSSKPRTPERLFLGRDTLARLEQQTKQAEAARHFYHQQVRGVAQ